MSPHHGDKDLEAINDVATLGAILQRSVDKRGYLVVDIPERDPDFHMIDGKHNKHHSRTTAWSMYYSMCYKIISRVLYFSNYEKASPSTLRYPIKSSN